ncbi:MAG: hypothetical protein AAGD86_12455, partial [Pseudomonadota bacterium]
MSSQSNPLQRWLVGGRPGPAEREALQHDFEESDALMLRVLFVHWLVAATVMGMSHGYYLMGAVGGGLICALGVIAVTVLRVDAAAQ